MMKTKFKRLLTQNLTFMACRSWLFFLDTRKAASVYKKLQFSLKLPTILMRQVHFILYICIIVEINILQYSFHY